MPKLAELLTEDTVRVQVSAIDWKDAIRKSGELLLDIGAIEHRYIAAMIKFCEEYNAYIVLAPGIALPHARAEDGVKRVCFSLITLEDPINFGNPQNDPVDLIVTFGAIDNKSHLRALAQIAEVLSNQKIIEKIRSAKTKEEILKIIEKY